MSDRDAPVDPPAGPGRRLRAWGRRELPALAELWALSGLAVAQPLLDTTGRAPDFFIFHSADAADIVLLVVVIVAAPPLALWVLGATTRLAGPRVRRAVHVLTVGALAAALAVEAGKWLLPLRGAALAILATGCGALVALA
jgi:hypothetical protein